MRAWNRELQFQPAAGGDRDRTVPSALGLRLPSAQNFIRHASSGGSNERQDIVDQSHYGGNADPQRGQRCRAPRGVYEHLPRERLSLR